MVWRKLLAGLGLGGVEADTVLTPTPATPGGTLTGQVNLRVKSDTDIASITLILVANGPAGEIELSRRQVSGALSLQGGGAHSVPFSIPVPAHAPFTVLYGQNLPGFTAGVRTELTVSSGSAKGDFDPVRIEASATQQHLMDALGTIGAKFAGNAVVVGSMVGLPVPAAQAVTFYAPVPEGQQLGPHIPQVAFLVAPHDSGLTVVAELAGRPGTGERHDLSAADIERLSTQEDGWVSEVDTWLLAALKKLGQSAAPGAFLQGSAPQPGYAPQQPGPRQPYAYGGRGGQQPYQYEGYRRGPSMAGSMMAGVAGGALGFLGTMMIMDMLTPDMPVDAGAGADAAADPAAGDPGAADAGGDYAAGDYGGDYGGDFGGDFGADFGGF